MVNPRKFTVAATVIGVTGRMTRRLAESTVIATGLEMAEE
jgi:hypothetical protein